MQIRIESSSQLPVYVQLKEQIKFLILTGTLEPGARLPTARQLGGFLNINRNTVLKAYQELVRDGLIECRRGAGCTVLEEPKVFPRSALARVLAVVDEAIEQAGELGVGPDDFAALAYARAKQRQDVHAKRRLLFVECSVEGAEALARRIEQQLDLEVTPVVLRDVANPTPEVEELLGQVDVIATTFFHIEQLRALLPKTKKRVLALSVKPHLDSLLEIARIGEGTTVLLVCLTESGAWDMQRSLEDAGIKGLSYVLRGVDQPERLAAAVAEHPVVVISDYVSDQVLPMLQPDQTSIVLDYTALDEGAIYLLKSVMGEGSPAMVEA
jgi:DNA-binding transcriptional regulator YhcF (GntR family)